MAIQRFKVIVQGIVQGVGFRPFVFNLADRLHLSGYVLNDARGVTIEIEAELDALEQFIQAMNDKAYIQQEMPLAKIESISVERTPSPQGNTTFEIIESKDTEGLRTLISPDAAICKDCVHDIFNPDDIRRFHYPFTNCTNCGPRFTIIKDLPYDRKMTTMQVFPMCDDCLREYKDPRDRRFHAQPIACQRCGPHVFMHDKDGQPVESTDPIRDTAHFLAAGDIFAIKGLGGYHLVCDALNEEAVYALRQRKQREAKPLALMVPDVATAEYLCEISSDELMLLQSRQSPIVLLNIRQREQPVVASQVAPGYDTLGLMLPYTPLHHLLLSACKEVFPQDRPVALVMTSGNVSEEPIAYKDNDAQQRLSVIVDKTLLHNREIHQRCDDSVTRIVAGGEQLFRRARGYAPQPIQMPFEFPVPLLACGANFKNTFCLGKQRRAYVSHHIGDFNDIETETKTSFQEAIRHFQYVFDVNPEVVVYDLHPQYYPTEYAREADIAQKMGVQHHHAHIASVLAEHGLEGKVIGIAADGTGYGEDGAIWGCEVIEADLLNYERKAHLAYKPLPGGDQAVHEPWRMAGVYLAEAYGDAFLNLDIPYVRQLDKRKWSTLAYMMEQNINCSPTSSMGRLFDAVAALLGQRTHSQYEGQAAVELEILAGDSDTPYDYLLKEGDMITMDVIPMIRQVVEDIQQGTAPARIATRFHQTLASMLAEVCMRIRERTGLERVALSGGVFQNRLLLEQLMTHLQHSGFAVYINRLVPPNDGGISLGQAAIAAARLRQV